MKARRVFFSFIIYGLGLIGLFVSDLYVVGNLSNDDVAVWAFAKSFVFIISVFFIRGLDQYIVRTPGAYFREKIKKYNEIPFFLLFALGVSYLLSADILLSISVSLCTLSLAILTLFASRARSVKSFLLAQLYTNGWKILLVVFLLLSLPPIYSIFFSLLLCVFLAFIMEKYVGPPDADADANIDADGMEVKKWFFIHNIAAVFSIYFEQLILTRLAGENFAGSVFSYNTIFASVALSLNGFIGFVLAPYLRGKNLTKGSSVKIYALIIIVLAFFFSSFSVAFGFYYNTYFNKIDDISVIIVSLIFISSFLRITYVLPSAILGVKANKLVLKHSAYAQIISLILFIIVYAVYLLSFKFSLVGVFSIVAIFQLLRFVIASYFSYMSIRI